MFVFINTHINCPAYRPYPQVFLKVGLNFSNGSIAPGIDTWRVGPQMEIAAFGIKKLRVNIFVSCSSVSALNITVSNDWV